MSLKLVIGLGNPGSKYAKTRHNAGFLAVEHYAKRHSLTFSPSSLNGEIARGEKGGFAFFLVKPSTFMNDSGRCVAGVANFYHAALADILIIYDDMDIELGTIRIRADGSSGGQRGMQSIIENLGTSSIQRIRVGIGRPSRNAGNYVVDHVLDTFSGEESNTLKGVLDRIDLAIDDFLSLPFDVVMNRHNGTGKTSPGSSKI